MKYHETRKFGKDRCLICGTEYWKRREAHQFCSKECASYWRMQQPYIKNAVMQKSVPKLLNYARVNGPWNRGIPASAEAREKMSIAQKKIDHSQLTGGNGTGGSWAEKLMRSVLSNDFIQEYTISVKPRRPGYPTHYKLDFGNPEKRIAIEVQGNSHAAVLGRVRDQKKKEFLEGLGWSVLYINNLEVKRMFGICT